jgi:rRNA maturation endonuclease Nob1
VKEKPDLLATLMERQARDLSWGFCCWACQPDYTLFGACPECGNKRCPRAADHKLSCTNSNEPGQPGSLYA